MIISIVSMTLAIIEKLFHFVSSSKKWIRIQVLQFYNTDVFKYGFQFRTPAIHKVTRATKRFMLDHLGPTRPIDY